METQVIVRAPLDLRESFKRYAESQEMTMSDLIRDFMKSKVEDA